MRVNAYLSFNGQCEAAFRLYETVLEGKITFMATFGESPMKETTPPEWHAKIMHATLEIGDQWLQGADAPPPTYEKPQGFGMAIELNDPARAERVFQGLSEGGVVKMPIEETFWAQRFGMLVDRFGVPWMINCGKPA